MPVKPFKRPGRARWSYKYLDESDKWVERTGTTSYGETDDIRRHKESQAKMVREGVIDPRELSIQQNSLRPIDQTIEEFRLSLNSRPQSVRWTVRYIERCVEHCRFERLRDFEAGRVDRWLKACFTSNRSHDAALKAIRHLMNWAIDHYYLSFNPTSPLKCKGEGDPVRPMRVLERKEFDRILSIAPTYRKVFYNIAAMAMIRWDEIERLRWRDINLEQRYITVSQGKARYGDVVPMYSELVDALARWKPQDAKPSDTVVTPQPRLRTWKGDLEKAGIPYKSGSGDLHRKCLRASGITWLLEAGVHLSHVAQIARHKDPKITLKHYAKLRLIDLNTAIEQLAAPTNTPQEGRLSGPLMSTDDYNMKQG